MSWMRSWTDSGDSLRGMDFLLDDRCGLASLFGSEASGPL